jgi:hypothetical protein
VAAKAVARIFLVPLGGAVAAGLWPVPALEVVDLDRHRVVASFPVRAFQLRYRHSLYGGRVWEHFAVAGMELVLVAVEAEREAAVEYYGFPQRVVRRGNRYRVFPVGRRMPELVVRGTATGQRTLLLGRFALPLYGHGREGHRFRVRVTRAPAAWVGLWWAWEHVQRVRQRP